MCRLVRTAEQHIDTLASSGLLPPAEASAAGASGSSERGRARAEVFKKTQQALETWRHMREGAKTPSTVLPAEDSELLRQLHARERWVQLSGRVPGEGGAAQAAGGAQQQPQQQEAAGEGAPEAAAAPAAGAGAKRDVAAAGGAEAGGEGDEGERDAKRLNVGS